ncbi:MAG: hypothetical protein JWO03_2002 [Bacteroidetes bacterium]|nr:hypothetical protein [Bacteroidota bacterium]
MNASYTPYQLHFRKPILTSRGGMSYKDGFYLTIEHNGVRGIGECSYIKGLSIDDLHHYQEQLQSLCSSIAEIAEDYYTERKLPEGLVASFPSIAFALETALLDLQHGGRHKIIADSAFYAGDQDIPINGLVWMGKEDEMQQQIEQKLADGYRCIKIKVGAIDFDAECRLLEGIRSRYTREQLEIRVDANGAFKDSNVRDKLTRLAAYDIHSIEQPIKPQQYLLMHQLSRENIIPIALDEELIGTHDKVFKVKLLETIRPQYIVLKPSLLGGMASCDEWIRIAEKLGISWWATSALEGNIGLNAIAQWAASKSETIVQGLGTGTLYTNNIPSPLYIENGHLKYDLKGKWG